MSNLDSDNESPQFADSDSGDVEGMSQPLSPSKQVPSEAIEEASVPADDELLHVLNDILRNQELLNAKFEQKLLYDNQKDTTIQKLHDDVDVYRRGIHLAMLRPLVEDLLRLYDAIAEFYGGLARRVQTLSDEAEAKLEANRLKNVESFLLDIQEMLRHNGFTVYQSSGEGLDSKRHRVVDTQPTDEAAQDKLIAYTRKLGIGYIRPDGNEQIIRPEYVVIFKYAPQPGETA